MISLNNVKMNVIQTASNGVVNKDTVFRFKQEGDIVTSEYVGGRVIAGFLVGKIKNEELIFSYCQLQDDGTLDNGVSSCELGKSADGKIRLLEHFEWKSRPGEKGTNIFEEIS